MIKKGQKYRRYKGRIYRVIAIGTIEATKEDAVIWIKLKFG